jgi:hypothetical protein
MIDALYKVLAAKLLCQVAVGPNSTAHRAVMVVPAPDQAVKTPAVVLHRYCTSATQFARDTLPCCSCQSYTPPRPLLAIQTRPPAHLATLQLQQEMRKQPSTYTPVAPQYCLARESPPKWCEHPKLYPRGDTARPSIHPLSAQPACRHSLPESVHPSHIHIASVSRAVPLQHTHMLGVSPSTYPNLRLVRMHTHLPSQGTIKLGKRLMHCSTLKLRHAATPVPAVPASTVTQACQAMYNSPRHRT